MSKIEDRLAASIKPGQGKGKTGGNKPGTPKKTTPAVIIPKPVSAPVAEPLPLVLPKNVPAPAQPSEGDVPDLNSPSRPLHPRRIWPD